MNQTKSCPLCSEQILVDAKKCKHCGEILDTNLKKALNKDKFNLSIYTFLAIILFGCFFLPWISNNYIQINGFEIPNQIARIQEIANLFSVNTAFDNLSTFIYTLLILAAFSLLTSFNESVSYIFPLITGTFILIFFYKIEVPSGLYDSLGFGIVGISLIGLIYILFGLNDTYIALWKGIYKLIKSTNKEDYKLGVQIFSVVFVFAMYFFTLSFIL